jgi:hypothetical protein
MKRTPKYEIERRYASADPKPLLRFRQWGKKTGVGRSPSRGSPVGAGIPPEELGWRRNGG